MQPVWRAAARKTSAALAVLREAAAQHYHRLLPCGVAHDVEETAAVVDPFKIDEGGGGLHVVAQRVEHVERARARLVADRHVLVDTDAAPLGGGHELHPDIAGLGDDAQAADLRPQLQEADGVEPAVRRDQAHAVGADERDA
jgi:hypothetical protein